MKSKTTASLLMAGDDLYDLLSAYFDELAARLRIDPKAGDWKLHIGGREVDFGDRIELSMTKEES